MTNLTSVLIVLDQIFIAMYIFELFYRAKLSPVAVAHHIGAVVIAQSAVAISLNWQHEQDATIEFILCFVWGTAILSHFHELPVLMYVPSAGAFDIVAEFWPHVAIILYRIYPDDHSFLRKVFRFACISTLSGTIIETVTVMWLFGSLWFRWTLPFKVVTPFLHLIFTAAQLWGAKNFRSMWLKQKNLQRAQEEDEERRAGIAMEASGKNKKMSASPPSALTSFEP